MSAIKRRHFLRNTLAALPAAAFPYQRLFAAADLANGNDVELWLVHQPPTGDERVVHVKPRFKGDWFQFTFLPLRIDTPRGTLNVEVGGALTVTSPVP